MSPQNLIKKAQRAVESARLLHQANDIDGACNRAYYAMFDAAKAALIVTLPAIDLTIAKTHSGLISAFGLHLIKTGLIPIEFGRAFNRAYDIRQIADYTGDLIKPEDVNWLLMQASDFVQLINTKFVAKSPQ